MAVKERKLIGFSAHQIAELQRIAETRGSTFTGTVLDAVDRYIEEMNIGEVAQRSATVNAELNRMLAES